MHWEGRLRRERPEPVQWSSSTGPWGDGRPLLSVSIDRPGDPFAGRDGLRFVRGGLAVPGDTVQAGRIILARFDGEEECR